MRLFSSASPVLLATKGLRGSNCVGVSASNQALLAENKAYTLEDGWLKQAERLPTGNINHNLQTWNH